MASEKVQQVLDIISGMTILELRDLNKEIEETFGVTAAAPVAIAAAPAAGGGGGAAAGAPGGESGRAGRRWRWRRRGRRSRGGADGVYGRAEGLRCKQDQRHQ